MSGIPLVLEAACRARIVTPAEMKDFRKSWAMVKALICVNPIVLPQGASKVGPGGEDVLKFLTSALPELLRVQPTGIYREVISTGQCNQKEFVKRFATLIAAPAETDCFRTGTLKQALANRTPIYVDNDEVGEGLCCVCAKRGALGRCTRCGLLMHHSCVSPRVPGSLLDCPRCVGEKAADAPGNAPYHEIEVGGPVRKNKTKK